MKTRRYTTSFLEAKEGLSLRTLEQYSKALAYLERECPKIPRKAEPLRQALKKVDSIWVRDAYWRVWQVFFRWCWWEYKIPNRMERVERPKVPEVEMRSLEPEELAMVLAAADDLRDKAIVALALDSGVRASEYGRLRILDIGTDTIRVFGKGNKQVRVPISPETRHLLQLLINQDGHQGPRSLLFPGHNGQPLSRFAVYRIVRRCFEEAGITGPKLGSHCLRHSLGKGYIAAGGDAFTLQRILRHRNISTTQKYVRLAMHDIIKQHHEHSPLRDAIRGAQWNFFDNGQLVKEAEDILTKKGI